MSTLVSESRDDDVPEFNRAPHGFAILWGSAGRTCFACKDDLAECYAVRVVTDVRVSIAQSRARRRPTRFLKCRRFQLVRAHVPRTARRLLPLLTNANEYIEWPVSGLTTLRAAPIVSTWVHIPFMSKARFSREHPALRVRKGER